MKACLEEAFVPHYSTLKQLKVTGMFLSWTSPLLPVERCECLIPAKRVNVTHFSPPFCDRKQIRMKWRLARFADDVPDPDDRVFPAQMRSYKRRRCGNAGRCRRRAEPAATFTVLPPELKVPLKDTVSGEWGERNSSRGWRVLQQAWQQEQLA